MAAVDRSQGGLGEPASHAYVVTPSDVGDIAFVTRALWVGGAGNVQVNMQGGETAVLISGIAAGTLIPIRVTRVYSANLTASLIVALD